MISSRDVLFCFPTGSDFYPNVGYQPRRPSRSIDAAMYRFDGACVIVTVTRRTKTSNDGLQTQPSTGYCGLASSRQIVLADHQNNLGHTVREIMDNPYSPPQHDESTSQTPILKSMIQRCIAIFLFVAGWICVGAISIATFTRFAGEIPSMSQPEAELTTFQSFAKFSVHYWFTAFVFLSPPTSIAIWFLLKRQGVKKTRWALLVIGLAISPLLIVIAWLGFRRLLLS